jgi:flagellar biosynthesis chaperone FliJ
MEAESKAPSAELYDLAKEETNDGSINLSSLFNELESARQIVEELVEEKVLLENQIVESKNERDVVQDALGRALLDIIVAQGEAEEAKEIVALNLEGIAELNAKVNSLLELLNEKDQLLERKEIEMTEQT